MEIAPRLDCPAFFPVVSACAMTLLRLSVFICLCLGSLSPASSFVAAAEPAGNLSFNADIRPILSENCFACHGFDAKHREADLRLDVPESATAKREAGFAIKPGDPAASEVWKRITTDDVDLQMPPPSSHKTLKPEQKEAIRRWIAEGAAYQKHWAFEPPAVVEPPRVKDKAWPKNEVDQFVLAKLEQVKLAPRHEADRPTLIRRVAFTLTGLPPTLAEVDEFLADQSPDAYERMVDRYLRSPHYGEEMARHWLDVARYADTHGLHLDNERLMYAYRDWVVKAFNDDLPYDEFTVWQLAGDLLPGATPEQITATGFNRCNVTTSEGGSIAEEWLYRNAVDRAATTMQTWMGLTGGCAVCHDHKYDPVSTKEFYSFYSFFYDAADPAMDGNINTTAPFFKIPKPGQQEALDSAKAREADALKQLAAAAKAMKYVDPAAADKTKTKDASAVSRAVTDVVFDDAWPLGSSVRNTSRNASTWLADPALRAPSGRRVLRQANAYFFEDKLQCQLTPVVVPDDAVVEVWLRPDPHNVPQAVSLLLEGGGNHRAWWGDEAALDGGIRGLALSERRGPLPKPGEWTKLSLTGAELGLKPGQRITQLTLQETGGVVYWDALSIRGRVEPAKDPLSSFSVWWKQAGAKPIPDMPGDLAAVLKDGPAKAKDHKPEAVAKLQEFYLTYVARPATDDLTAKRKAWLTARAAREAADTAIEGTMVFGDVPTPREAFVMLRGQYDKPGVKVEPGVPAVLPPLEKRDGTTRANRLDLARWLVSPEHPLTARVQANRLWQQVFGVGLVKTSGDFGSQGEPPLNAALLDWLAIRLQKGPGARSRASEEEKSSPGAWRMKDYMRLLVTSAAFRQESLATPEVLARDPENRLLARGPRMRLDAEQIRDNVLAVSGLINWDMGGAGFRSYQPPNIWEPVGYADSNTRYYLQDHGPALYRRSIYAFLKRTAPPPFMSNFDGPNREQACARRERSNTPLQALQLMNDVQHFEAARALAERALAEAGGSREERITWLYRTVLARQPDADELKIVAAAHEKQLAMYRADPQAAKAAIHVGESTPKAKSPSAETAAWTLTANLILNLDETVNRN